MSALEDSVGIRFDDLTLDEINAIYRIKFACRLLTEQEREYPLTDVLTELGVAIVAELRRAERNGAQELMADLVEKGEVRLQR